MLPMCPISSIPVCVYLFKAINDTFYGQSFVNTMMEPIRQRLPLPQMAGESATIAWYTSGDRNPCSVLLSVIPAWLATKTMYHGPCCWYYSSRQYYSSLQILKPFPIHPKPWAETTCKMTDSLYCKHMAIYIVNKAIPLPPPRVSDAGPKPYVPMPGHVATMNPTGKRGFWWSGDFLEVPFVACVSQKVQFKKRQGRSREDRATRHLRQGFQCI